jgi:ankyrin repeat protein
MVGALLLIAVLAGAKGPAPVADAAMRGDRTQVRALIAKGADVNEAQGDGMTALHWAAERGNVELTTVLLGAGARVSATTRLGRYTPLHLAARRGHDTAALTLINAGADVSAIASTGVAPLHLAAAAGSRPLVEALLAKGAAVDSRARDQATPLMVAALDAEIASWGGRVADQSDRILQQRKLDGEIAQRGFGAAERTVKRRLGGVIDRRAVIEDDAQNRSTGSAGSLYIESYPPGPG